MVNQWIIFGEFIVIFGGLWRFTGERYKHVKKLCAPGRVNQNSEIEKGIYEYAKYFVKKPKSPRPLSALKRQIHPD